MPGWRSLVLKVAIGVILLDLLAVVLQRLPGALPGVLLVGDYGLAIAGVGWLIASHMMLRAIELRDRDELDEEPLERDRVAVLSPDPVVHPTGSAPDAKAWVRLVEDCVELVDELDRAQESFDPVRRELADHVLVRLEEILDQPGVQVITGEKTFARDRHRLDRPAAGGGAIAETLSPGFAIGRRVLRRARVRLETSGG